jgi:hypothetical protein
MASVSLSLLPEVTNEPVGPDCSATITACPLVELRETNPGGLVSIFVAKPGPNEHELGSQRGMARAVTKPLVEPAATNSRSRLAVL